jgi:T5SS/PEP-CTERM-associated repeat protein
MLRRGHNRHGKKNVTGSTGILAGTASATHTDGSSILRTMHTPHRLITLATCLASALVLFNAHGSTNSWIDGNGAWHDATKWSFPLPPSGNDEFDYITNSGTKTVTIDRTTSTTYPATLTINNLTVSAPAGYTSTLALSNSTLATPLTISNSLTIGPRGVLNLITNSALYLPSPPYFTSLYDDGRVNITNSWIYATNISPIYIAYSQANTIGSMTLNGGGILGSELHVGTGLHSIGTFTMHQGQLLFPGFGTNIMVGNPGSAGGFCTINGGTVQASLIFVGFYAPGTMTLNGGNISSAYLSVGFGAGSTGTVSVVGAHLTVTNNWYSEIAVGFRGDGTLLIGTNGIVEANYLRIATNGAAGNQGHGQLILQPGGTLIVGSKLVVGDSTDSTGEFKVTGGTATVPELVIGQTQGSGALNVTNGTVTVSNLLVGLNASGTGVVNIAGGTLTATNGVVQLGPSGSGQMNISGGSTTVGQLLLGGTTNGGSGELHLTSGHLRVLSLLRVNACGIEGGDLDGSGGTVILGEAHDAAMTVSGGTATNIGSLFVGYTPGFTGSYSQDGGYVSVVTNVVVGNCTSGAVGNMNLDGGFMLVHGAAQPAVLDVRNGTVTLGPSGALVVDTLVLTNSCAHFTYNGGYISYNQLVLPPDAPPLRLKISYNRATSAVTLSWPSIYVGYFLEQNPDLAPGNWSAVSDTPADNGTTRSVTITPATGNMFYRLSKPL